MERIPSPFLLTFVQEACQEGDLRRLGAEVSGREEFFLTTGRSRWSSLCKEMSQNVTGGVRKCHILTQPVLLYLAVEALAINAKEAGGLVFVPSALLERRSNKGSFRLLQRGDV